jgi:shikimate dehydrogenase
VTATISARTIVAAVAGSPIDHSLSPLIHNAWIAAAGLDAVYVALAPPVGHFVALATGLRGGVMAGLNVTAPFKREALAVADRASHRAQRAGAANLLIFAASGEITADNTDGEGLLDALAGGAPGFDLASGPVVILGAGGAARGAATAFLDAGAPAVRLINRSLEKAMSLANELGGAITAISPKGAAAALADASVVVNATPTAPAIPLESAPATAVVVDMVYRPLVTPLLARAEALGLATVDGLAMLIGQARPSFAALFGAQVPDVDVRALAVSALERP